MHISPFPKLPVMVDETARFIRVREESRQKDWNGRQRLYSFPEQ